MELHVRHAHQDVMYAPVQVYAVNAMIHKIGFLLITNANVNKDSSNKMINVPPALQDVCHVTMLLPARLVTLQGTSKRILITSANAYRNSD